MTVSAQEPKCLHVSLMPHLSVMAFTSGIGLLAIFAALLKMMPDALTRTGLASFTHAHTKHGWPCLIS